MKHSDRLHAVLSASGSHIWINCTKQARAVEHLPELKSDYADEGTLAHTWSEHWIRYHYNAMFYKDTKALYDAQEREVLAIGKDRKWDMVAMRKHVEAYGRFVLDKFKAYSKLGEAIMLQEVELDLSHIIPESWGHVDVSILIPGIVDVTDLKYGAGVPVDVEMNEQLMIYALGVLHKYRLYADFEKVRLTIYQPRIAHGKPYEAINFEISVADLEAWSRRVLRPAALLAWNNAGSFKAGDHCGFCKIRKNCRTRAEYLVKEVQEKRIALQPHFLQPAELVKIKTLAPQIRQWLNDVDDLLLHEMNNGKAYDGLKLVKGKSNRKYTDEQKIKNLLLARGYKENQIINSKLIGLGDMESLLGGAGNFEKLLAPYILKGEASPTVVLDTDPRPVIAPLKDVRKMFADTPVTPETTKEKFTVQKTPAPFKRTWRGYR